MDTNLDETHRLIPLLLPFFWIAVTSFLSSIAGWYRLAARYPDRIEDAVFTLRRQSASMGPGVGFRGLLTLEACRSGLRVRMNRLFSPFSRPFFVPWSEISVARRTGIFLHGTEFSFGTPAQGRLILRPSTVAKLLASTPTLQREFARWRSVA